MTNLCGVFLLYYSSRISSERYIPIWKSPRIAEGSHKNCLFSFEESGLESIDIPNGVMYIKKGAFWMCQKLRSVHIPISVSAVDFYGSYTYLFTSVFDSLSSLYLDWDFPPSETSSYEYEIRDWHGAKDFTVYVPMGSRDAYMNSNWQYFHNIVEYDTTSLRPVRVTLTEKERYSVDGRLINSPQRGLNIVRYSNGTVVKSMTK